MAASRSLPDLQSTRFTRGFERRRARAIADGSLLARGDRVLVGFSGGPDSTALLVALSHLKKELGIQVRAAHFDHRLRSREEAEGDAAFVRALCRKLRVPVEFGSGNVRARTRRKKESIEEAARAMRYRFLKRAAKRLGSTVVAVAHNRDDQAETVLMRMIRGAGLDGIAGMRPRARWPFGRGPSVVRPLLDVPRAEIERYCEELGVEPRRDPTNDLLVGTRNRIRGELLPLLRTFNPRIEDALARLADAASQDLEFVEEFQLEGWRQAASRDRGGIAIDRRFLERLDAAITSRVIRRAASELSDGAIDVKWEDVRRVLRSLTKQRARTILPDGLVAVTDPYNVTIWAGEPQRTAAVPHVTIPMAGSRRVGKWRFDVSRGDPSDVQVCQDAMEALLDEDAVGFLSVRSRQPGDRLRPLGLGGSKKVQDILVDAKVPADKRDGVPIVCDERGIVWVVGHCIDERVKVTKKTKDVLRIVSRRA
jgi:tRNA(Ile)-lysidine synthase